MQLFIDTIIEGIMKKNAITLEVEGKDTIQTIKKKIENIQIIMFGGRLLNDNRILSDYNVGKESNYSVGDEFTMTLYLLN